jgi:hypothetical protein
MTDSLAIAIRERVNSFLAGDLTLLQFQDWLVANTWDVEEQGDPHATDLTYEIKLALAEHSRGDISEDELRERMSQAVKTAVHAAM